MGSSAKKTPLVVLLGPTASGKSALALKLAALFGGEIIAADSRTIYKGMDIGTAKPTQDERFSIRHHLLDVVSPSDRFTVADFQREANAAIVDISSRNKLPLLVGGSGLYIDSVIYNFSFRPSFEPWQREKLENLPTESLLSLLQEQEIDVPGDGLNRRHLVRALESGGVKPQRDELRPRTILIGLDPGKEILERKIARRVEDMVAAGFVEEVRRLYQRHDRDIPALQAPGYKAFRQYLEGDISIDEAKQLFARRDLQYAKRQKTWFKRNTDIHWISKLDEAVDLLTTFLNK